jgi:hypothetical protein
VYRQGYGGYGKGFMGAGYGREGVRERGRERGATVRVYGEV